MIKIKETLAIICIGAFFIMMFLGIIFIMFLGANHVLSNMACGEEGYMLYEVGDIITKEKPICEYFNETTMNVEYIKLGETAP